MADLISSFLMFDRPAASGDAKTVRKRIDNRVEPADAAAREEVQHELANVLRGESVILRLGSDRHPLAVRLFLERLVRLGGDLEASRQEAAIAKLAEVILPDELAEARGALALDDLTMRDRFVAETSPFTSAEVSAQAGAQSGNAYATAARWKKAGAIFSVNHRGAEFFPSFQFRDGRPHPTVKAALAALPAAMSPWQRAFWFVSANGWLDDRTPAGSLDDVEAVMAAARYETEEVMG